MSDSNTSTFQSYVDSATGAAQSALGSLTGNPADKAQGQNTQDKAQLENDASHTVGKIGNVNIGPNGATSVDDSNRTDGSWNQTIGSAKEAIGGLVGADGLKAEGQRQNEAGKGQEAQGQLSDFGTGVADRAKGAFGGAVAGVTGDRDAQAAYQAQHDTGKVTQRSAEADIQKQADA
ncbi:MAG: hypothetical protein M1838_000451 [Thelocarpon superellum]|nr:MAG: hypothetical protein M1838_000451 [Thelocarpon superellum]